MKNQDLYELFQEASQQDTCFDTIAFLKANKKKYKQSQFYKTTHYSIMQAYQLFQLDGLHTLMSIFTNRTIRHMCHGDFVPMQMAIENFIDNIDFSHLEGIATLIADKLNNATLDTEKLKEEFENVLKDIKNK